MKKVRKIILWILLLALVAALAILPVIARERAEENDTAMLLTASVRQGEIAGTLSGGGTLSAEDELEVTVPSGVELTEYLVENGEHVTEGTPVAAVDKVSVMAAVVELQKTLDTLAAEIKDAANDKGTATLTAVSEGRVKAIHVKKGDDVRAAMLRHGCLAVLSLDGLMAVSIATEADLRVGQSLRVAITGGKTYEGRVESCLEGVAVVTLTDNGPRLDDEAVVRDKEGNELGRGRLTVHRGLNIIAESGTVTKIYVKDGAKVAKGANLIGLENMDQSAEYESLSAKRQEYAALMQELFTLYRDGVVKAPGDGYLIDTDDSLVKNLSAREGGWRVVMLADEDPPVTIQFYLQGTVQEKAGDTVTIAVDSIGPSDQLDTLLALLTGQGTLSELISQLQGVAWNKDKITAVADGMPSKYENIQRGDECTANYMLISSSAGLQIEQTQLLVTVRSSGSGGFPGGLPGGGTMPGMGGMIGMGGMGGMGGYGGVTAAAEEEDTLFDLEGTVIGSLVPDNSMTVSFPVDELDILQFKKGMEAEIAVDALPGRTFHGTVTKIGSIGTSEGGNSKYTVTVSFDRTGDMLEGMNASVVVHTGTVSGLLVPAACLTDSGSRTYVYTGLDADGTAPAERTEVTVGISDGEQAQILSGLEEGQTVYYIYYGQSQTAGQ
ncbi:MAG: HlyD family efflux transporter periplasmic adaptor subunit [Oscillospiraceae bacterium]|nr:HlyD family efflux transporter periplasmic adaptor subunit [Oscillospiraceae bacterium]